MPLCDFHVHSTASDGKLSPSRLVEEAARSSLAALALTDHDTLAGVAEARTRANQLGLLFIPAVELSVDLHTGGSAHLLGYFPGVPDSRFLDSDSELQKAVKTVISGRDRRNPEIVSKFRELGFSITMDEVLEEADGAVTGRPHIAAVLVKKGYFSSSREVFDRYLGSGKPAYVNRERLGDFKAVKIIRQAGGLPVLAHPKYIRTEGLKGLEALICSLADAGLSGLEAYYPEQGPEIVSLLEKTAEKRNLLLTGGSDFHGIKRQLPGWNDGSFGVEEELVREFITVCRDSERILNGHTERADEEN
ncbi:phosphoesterase [Candidatus Fermentibacteria bacterium]|nr:MAG: phosphoesterase [Candidatus Fermentibacteria bacterium]